MKTEPRHRWRAKHKFVYLPVFALVVLAVGAMHYLIFEHVRQRAIDAEALRMADVVSRNALASAKTMAQLSTEPATPDSRDLRLALLHQALTDPANRPMARIGTDPTAQAHTRVRLRSRSQPPGAPEQPASDGFEQWGFEQLQAHEPAERGPATSPSGWKPVWRFEGTGDQRVLRYLRADPVLNATCLACHGRHAGVGPGKMRAVATTTSTELDPAHGNIVSAVQVDIAMSQLDAADRDRMQMSLLFMLAASSLGIGLAGRWAWFGARQERRDRDRSETALLLRTSALHSALGEAAKALRFAQEALKAARNSRVSGDIAAAHEGVGDVLCSEGRVEDGSRHWRAALQLLRNLGRHRHAARLCLKLAAVCVDAGAGADAVRWRRRAAVLELKALDGGSGSDHGHNDLPMPNVDDQRWRAAEMAFHTAKMAAVGRMVAGVNHELKQPLVSLRLLAATCLERLERGESEHVRRGLSDMMSMADQLATLTSALDNFSRKQPVRPTMIHLSVCVREALRVLGPQLNKPGREVVVKGDDPALTIDPDRVRLILVNLLSNAIDATANEANKRVEVEMNREAEYIALRVRDFGRGFPPEVQQHLFELFVTTKPEGRGLGLGLALCAKMAREMGGTLHGRNHPQGGAEFTLRLPLDAAQANA